MRVAFVGNVVHTNDILVVERRGRAPLAVKSIEVGFVIYPLFGQDFDGALLAENGVLREIDRAHPAGPQVLQQFVFAEKKSFVAAVEKFLAMPLRD